MNRYIDTDKAIARLNASPAFSNMGTDGFFLREIVLQILGEQPTADVVEVVRCKDCKHLEIINSRDVYAKCRMTDLEFKPFDIDTRKHYCSYGERREENEG